VQPAAAAASDVAEDTQVPAQQQAAAVPSVGKETGKLRTPAADKSGTSGDLQTPADADLQTPAAKPADLPAEQPAAGAAADLQHKLRWNPRKLLQKKSEVISNIHTVYDPDELLAAGSPRPRWRVLRVFQ